MALIATARPIPAALYHDRESGARAPLLRLILRGHNSKVRFRPGISWARDWCARKPRRFVGRRNTRGGFIPRTQARGADSARSGAVQRQSARDESDAVAG